MLSSQKKSFFSLFSPPSPHLHPDFLFEISVISGRGNFFERAGGNSLKRTYVEGGGEVHVKRTGTNKGLGGGQKLEVSSERTF